MSNLKDVPVLDLLALIGANLTRSWLLRDKATQEPTDLTGWTPSLVISKAPGGTVLLELGPSNGLTIPTPADGTIVLSVFPTSGDLADFALPAGDYHYRMRLVASDSNVWALWRGTLGVRAQ